MLEGKRKTWSHLTSSQRFPAGRPSCRVLSFGPKPLRFLPEDGLWLPAARCGGWRESGPPGRSQMCVDLTSQSVDEHAEAGGGPGPTALLSPRRGGSRMPGPTYRVRKRRSSRTSEAWRKRDAPVPCCAPSKLLQTEPTRLQTRFPVLPETSTRAPPSAGTALVSGTQQVSAEECWTWRRALLPRPVSRWLAGPSCPTLRVGGGGPPASCEEASLWE